MDGRWSELDDCIAEQSTHSTQPRYKTPTIQQPPPPPRWTSWKEPLASPLAVPSMTALFVLAALLIIRPPFVYTRRRSKIHPEFYVESFSPYRLIAWTSIAGAVALIGSDTASMCHLPW
jgi:hypothetical protein